MDDKRRTLKQQLPFPYNQDLSTVLRRLNRKRMFSRKRLANSPVTAAYLAAAIRLIERHLGPGAERMPLDPADENSLERPLLSFLSQRAVVGEMKENPTPLPRMGNVSTMRSTWSSHSDFIADLLSFALWSQYHPARWESEKASEAIEQLLEGTETDLAHSIHELAYRNLMLFLGRPRFRLRLVAAAVAEGDQVIGQALGEFYTSGMQAWREVLSELLSSRGLQLRPDIDPDDVINMLAAAAEGTALRALADPSAKMVDHGARRSLLGTTGLALILACVERVEDPDGMTLEEAAQAKVYGMRTDSTS